MSVILPRLFFPSAILHNHPYISLTLRVCNDHPNILPLRGVLQFLIFINVCNEKLNVILIIVFALMKTWLHYVTTEYSVVKVIYIWVLFNLVYRCSWIYSHEYRNNKYCPSFTFCRGYRYLPTHFFYSIWLRDLT